MNEDPLPMELAREVVGEWLKRFMADQKSQPGRPLVYIVKADELVRELKRKAQEKQP